MPLDTLARFLPVRSCGDPFASLVYSVFSIPYPSLLQTECQAKRLANYAEPLIGLQLAWAQKTVVPRKTDTEN